MQRLHHNAARNRRCYARSLTFDVCSRNRTCAKWGKIRWEEKTLWLSIIHTKRPPNMMSVVKLFYNNYITVNPIHQCTEKYNFIQFCTISYNFNHILCRVIALFSSTALFRSVSIIFSPSKSTRRANQAPRKNRSQLSRNILAFSTFSLCVSESVRPG